jgi:hypothetical protein
LREPSDRLTEDLHPRRAKKKPGVKTPGWEALLLSHIKAPAQGGKAGNGKPLDAKFNKEQTTYQAFVN